MLPMSTVAAILIAVLNISFVIASSETDKVEIYWVSTSLDRCKDKWPCNTLEGYKEEDITLNRSNVTWIFLKGQHVMPFPLNLEFVENVTLRGEDECFANQCTLILPNGSISVIYLVGHLRIQNLQLFSSELSELLFTYISNLLLYHVNATEHIKMHYLNPINELVAKYCTFSEVHFHFTSFGIDFFLNIFVLLTDCKIIPSGVQAGLYAVIEDVPSYSKIDIAIQRGHFFNKAFYLRSPNHYGPLQFLQVTFDRCAFEYNISGPKVFMKHIIYVYFQVSLNQDQWYSNLNHSPQVYVRILQCHFYSLEPLDKEYCSYSRPAYKISVLNVQLSANYSDFTVNSNMTTGPLLLIQDTIIEKSKAEYIIIGNFLHQNTMCKSNNPIWEIKNCTISCNQKMQQILCRRRKVDPFVLMYLSGFNVFPVFFSGGNKIHNNIANVAVLQSTKLLIGGYNEIIDNLKSLKHFRHSSVFQLSVDSQIALLNNSILNISNNEYKGIFVSEPKQSTFIHFINCYVKKQNCSGFCIFQLLSSNKEFLSKKDLLSIKAKIYLHKNTKPEIFNGHLFNCSLLTTEGLINADLPLLKTFIDIEHWKGDISSPPYHICLCPQNSQNRFVQHRWNCSDRSKVSHYPGQKLLLYVSILGDLGINLQYHLRSSIKGSQAANFNFVTGACSAVEIPMLSNNSLTNDYQVELEAEQIYDKYNIIHLVMVNVSACPPGFSLSKYGYNQTSKHCICMPHLSNYIKCTITNFGVHYQAHLPHYWIQIDKETVLYSDYCLTVYCNDILFEKGITLESSNQQSEVQCSNGRVGKLCGSCPKGYSTTFGSSACRKCQGPWYLLAIILGFVGLLLVVILFLLNLTVLQGTILGVSFYANITYLYSDYFEQYGGPFLYAILSWLNFGVGFELCFFDGMDEFTKAILQFVFPTYLFVILLVIIIGAHKYNWKIFRVPFIAKRAVPVLATMMLLTYSNIAGAVIIPLRFSTIYSTNGETTTVWLQQGDIPYFQGKHLVLVILSLAFTLFYLFPLTFILLFGDILRRYTRKLWFSHFLDVFYGAFRRKLGFWLGLRLLVRIFFSIVRISTSTNTFTHILFYSICLIFVIELILKPFQLHTTPNENDSENETSCKAKFLLAFQNFLHPNNLDPLFLFNIILTPFAVVDLQGPTVKYFNSNVSILLLIMQLFLIVAYHCYKYFPIQRCLSKNTIKDLKVIGASKAT